MIWACPRCGSLRRKVLSSRKEKGYWIIRYICLDCPHTWEEHRPVGFWEGFF